MVSNIFQRKLFFSGFLRSVILVFLLFYPCSFTHGKNHITPVKDKLVKSPSSNAKLQVNYLDFFWNNQAAMVKLKVNGLPQYKVIQTSQNSLTLELQNCTIPAHLEKSIDTSSASKLVQNIDIFSSKNTFNNITTVISATYSDSTQQKVIALPDGSIKWYFFPKGMSPTDESQLKSAQTILNKQKKSPSVFAGLHTVNTAHKIVPGQFSSTQDNKYSGKRISLEFKDIDIHDVLRLISNVSYINIITSDDVQGQVTIKMDNVPWDQALDVILSSKGLGQQRLGNIIRVAPLEVLQQESKMALQERKAQEILEPLKIRIIPINYSRAAPLKNQVKELLSDRGKVSMDKRTNVLIVKDIEESLIKIEELVKKLDTPTPQVLIETRIVEAERNIKQEVGIQWGGDLSMSPEKGNSTGLLFPNTVHLNGAGLNSLAVNIPTGVTNGAKGGGFGFSLGSVSGGATLNMVLSALEEEGTIDVISAPKIIALDNKEATIRQGYSIPVESVSAAGTEIVFIDALMELKVTPHITSDGRIFMKLDIKKDEPDFTRSVRGHPSILKKQGTTELLVNNGDTKVIGGIYFQKTSLTTNQVPLFGRIPVLGWLFKGEADNSTKTELLIFITPKIIPMNYLKDFIQ